MSEALIHWVIYKNPRDYPGRFVVRRWTIGRGTLTGGREPAAVVATLDEARAVVPPGCYCQPALPDDDPAIAEVWL